MRGPAAPQALQESAGQHGGKVGRQQRNNAAGGEHRQSDVNRRFAPDAVGQRAVKYLPHGHAEDQHGDDILRIVGVGAADTEVAPDQGERRYGDVDGKREHRHHERREGDEFGAAQGGPGRCHGRMMGSDR